MGRYSIVFGAMRQCKPADHAGAGLLALIRASTAAKSDPAAMTPGVAIADGLAVEGDAVAGSGRD